MWHLQGHAMNQLAKLCEQCAGKITGRKTQNSVLLYALKLGMKVGLIFACCSSSVFSIRVLLDTSAERKVVWLY